MTLLTDATLAHLRRVMDWPDLGPRYRVTGRLAQGGMSAVFTAHDTVLDREVAVKVHDLDDPGGDASARLALEARVLARLEHPGIVPVHDAGHLADGRLFYVMKRVRGARLDEAARALTTVDDRLRLFERVLEAVAFAHAHDIVHRDLKPDNVMVGEFGEVLVLDWGVARVHGDAGTGMIVGTPGFMAPEQASGHTVDQRADVHALGALLLTLLTAPVPRPLAAIAGKAMATDPGTRYQTVVDLHADLRRFRAGDPVRAYRETVVERTGRLARRYQVPIALVLAYLFMRMALLVWTR